MGIVEVKNVNIVLFDFNKLVLFQQRTDDSNIYPGCWNLFGGGINKNESPEEALKREILEELEYSLTNPFFMLEQVCKEGDYYGIRGVYGEQYDPTQRLVLHEGKGMGWFSIAEARNIMMGREDRKLIDIIEGKF